MYEFLMLKLLKCTNLFGAVMEKTTKELNKLGCTPAGLFTLRVYRAQTRKLCFGVIFSNKTARNFES